MVEEGNFNTNLMICVLSSMMKKGFHNVLAASIVFSMVTIPNYSYANELGKTVTVSSEEQALKVLKTI